MEERFYVFTNHINSINRSIRRIKNFEMKEYNLKSPHVSCLYYLYRMKELSIKELTRLCDIDKAAISRILDFLLNNGFIVLNKYENKSYKSTILLTDKGNEVGKFISDKIDSILKEASIALTLEERTILYKALDIIDNRLKERAGKE